MSTRRRRSTMEIYLPPFRRSNLGQTEEMLENGKGLKISKQETSKENVLRRPRIPASELVNNFPTVNMKTAKHLTPPKILPQQKNDDKLDKSTCYKGNMLEETPHNFEDSLKAFMQQETTYELLSTKCKANIGKAMEDPNQVPMKSLMDLVEFIVECVAENMIYCEAAVKFCISIIRKEKNQVFIEYLISTFKQCYRERDNILRGKKTRDGTRFIAFIWFLTEMYIQLKIRQLWNRFKNLQVEMILLSILTKCCQSCVSLPITDLSEIECLYSVLSSIGHDIGNLLPLELEKLMEQVRDAFLASGPPSSVQRILLQLIELYGSNWQKLL